MRDIMLFLNKDLLTLTVEGSRAIEKITEKPVNYCDRPMILT